MKCFWLFHKWEFLGERVFLKFMNAYAVTRKCSKCGKTEAFIRRPPRL